MYGLRDKSTRIRRNIMYNFYLSFTFTDFHLDDSNETARQLWAKIELVHALSMLH
jgi:geranylgeranyl pyrophosphate synthase